jgi:hypothetical protein
MDSTSSPVSDLSGLVFQQARIDVVADDLVSRERHFESIDSDEFSYLLGIRPDLDSGWINHRAWTLRSNLPPGDYKTTPEELKSLRQPWWKHRNSNRKISDLLAEGVCYSLYELEAEEALFTRGASSIEGLLGWAQFVSSEYILKSTSGIPVRFTRLLSKNGEVDIFGPYIDGLDFDPALYHELRFFVEPYNWDILEDQTTHIYEMGCCEEEIWGESPQYCNS